MKILALMPDAYGGFGGIAQYNRDCFDAINEIEDVDTVVSLCRLHSQSNSKLPEKLTEICVAGNEAFFVTEAIRYGLKIRPDLILCGHMNLLPVAGILKRILHARIVLELYGIEAWQSRGNRMFEWAISQVDLALSISRYTRLQFLQWADLSPHRVRVVPNAIHLEKYRDTGKPEYLIKRYGLRGKKILLTLGRLSADERYKGHDRIISLMPALLERYPDLIYIIAGDGDDRTRLERLAKRVGVYEQIRFIGRVATWEMTDHYNLADAFAMPSTGEGFGFVFLEAAACGVPVLGGGVDGSRDALLDGKLGVVVDPNNPVDLLNGLKQVLRMPKRVPEGIAAFAFDHFKMQIRDILAHSMMTAQKAK